MWLHVNSVLDRLVDASERTLSANGHSMLDTDALRDGGGAIRKSTCVAVLVTSPSTAQANGEAHQLVCQ